MRSSFGSGPNKSIIRRRQVLSSINNWWWGGSGGGSPSFTDYTNNIQQEWLFNRGIAIEVVSDTDVDYLTDQRNGYLLFNSGTMNVPVNGRIVNTNGFSTQAAPGLGFTGDVSFAFCVSKSTASGAIQILFDSVAAPAFQFQTQISGANLDMRFAYNGVNYALTGQQFPYDSDFHTVVVRARTDAGTVKLSVVIDGTLRGSEISATGSMINWSAATARRFLRSASTVWAGSISRLRIYKEWVTVENCALLSQSNSVFKQTDTDNSSIRFYATWGQSNWLGEPYATTSELPADRQTAISRSFLFVAPDITGQILSEVRPLNGPGPIIELAYQLSNKYSSNNYFIQTAQSGVSQAVNFNSRTAGNLWVIFSDNVKNILNKFKYEERNVTDVGIADYQGEADAANATWASNFETNRNNFYDDIEVIILGIFPSADIKITAVRISSGLSIVNYPDRDTIRTALANIASSRSNMVVVNIDDQTIGADGTHLLTLGLMAAGARCSNDL